ncbi:MAG: PilZ domain-containing protein [Methylomonas sp.]|nr:PilZ domain-containing protein [Methylomonas sp.]PPD21203.1 MAG: pilus assembly protein PilZ [Methylomonas sp.]PPD27690.1 MAG: pilus assembly protein PilZ [Methylomonas sp.]PPD38890.1 MAG: pilus assembly protein PilZ [Methylomonas sp.]PPD39675.1 MAG: pilus assembly protein PilZ [Methylomonas sp.]
MLTHDEKRDYIRMDVDCDLTYKQANTDIAKTGRCTTLSGAGVSFIADQPLEAGNAIEISVIPKNNLTPPMTAFVEVVRVVRQNDGQYEIAGVIKGIKGN